jgi:hypothetical protein
MNRSQIENLCQLTAYLAFRAGLRPLPNVTQDASEIHAHARQLHKLAEADCNTGLTKRQQAREDLLQRRTVALLEPYGLKAKFGGDPRGYVVKILGLPGNTWGGDSEGFGVG